MNLRENYLISRFFIVYVLNSSTIFKPLNRHGICDGLAKIIIHILLFIRKRYLVWIFHFRIY